MSGTELQCGSKAIHCCKSARPPPLLGTCTNFFEVQSSGQSPCNPLLSSHSHHISLSRPVLDTGPFRRREIPEKGLSLLRICFRPRGIWGRSFAPRVIAPRTAQVTMGWSVRMRKSGTGCELCGEAGSKMGGGRVTRTRKQMKDDKIMTLMGAFA